MIHALFPFLLLWMMLLMMGTARAELLLPAEHAWGVATTAASGEIVEYHLCDDEDRCEFWGVGEPLRAGQPLRVNHVSEGMRTLRARYCRLQDGLVTEDCGPFSAPSAPFRFGSELATNQIVANADLSAWDSLLLRPGERAEATILLGFAPPLADPTLVLDLKTSRRGAGFEVKLRGMRDPERVYLSERISTRGRSAEVVLSLPQLTQALLDGEEALLLEVDVFWGKVTFGIEDGSAGEEGRAPHIRAGALFGTTVALFDSDQDGVPVWSEPALEPCKSGQWIGCFDNCAPEYNPEQTDSNGDGVGDHCPSSGVEPEPPTDLDPPPTRAKTRMQKRFERIEERRRKRAERRAKRCRDKGDRAPHWCQDLL